MIQPLKIQRGKSSMKTQAGTQEVHVDQSLLVTQDQQSQQHAAVSGHLAR